MCPPRSGSGVGGVKRLPGALIKFFFIMLRCYHWSSTMVLRYRVFAYTVLLFFLNSDFVMVMTGAMCATEKAGSVMAELYSTLSFSTSSVKFRV